MIRRFFLTIPLLLATCTQSPPDSTPISIPNTGNTAAEIHRNIPAGIPAANAQLYMQQQGYAITTTTNLLTCTRDEPIRPGLTRRWQVLIHLRNSHVSHLTINNSLATQVQAREASQWPR
ncbi:MAG: hypothetical protein FWD53_00735 [Phycisphaerales bacterium]|nr:hypothetical protein [Phycisphaerales bacterium]